MRRWLWTAGAIASTVWAVGCARQVKIDEAKLGQLPLEDKQAIFTAQHNVTVAEANQAAAKRAGDQSQTFRDVAKSEFNSAKERSKAADKALELGQKSNDEVTIRTSQRQAEISNKQLSAAQAKLDYSDALVKLRMRETELAGDRVVAARNDLTFIQADALRRRGIEPGVKMSDVIAARDRDNSKLMRAERDVAAQRDNVNALRVAWDQRRQAFNLAQREAPSIPPVRAPQAPQKIEPAPLPEQPAVPQEMAPPPSGGHTM
jgi:hypothetical protein